MSACRNGQKAIVATDRVICTTGYGLPVILSKELSAIHAFRTCFGTVRTHLLRRACWHLGEILERRNAAGVDLIGSSNDEIAALLRTADLNAVRQLGKRGG